MRAMRKLLGAVCGLSVLGMAAAAPANTIQFVLQPGAPTPVGGGEYAFTYDVILTGSSQIENGSFVTFYDFLGYVDSSAGFQANALEGFANTDFQLSVGLQGLDAAPVSVSDDASQYNFTIKYLGNLFPDPPVGNVTTLGTFTARSTYGTVGTPYVTVSQDLAADVATGITLSDQYTKTTNVSGPVAVPVPAAVWGGLGLLSLLGVQRLRRARVGS